MAFFEWFNSFVWNNKALSSWYLMTLLITILCIIAFSCEQLTALIYLISAFIMSCFSSSIIFIRTLTKTKKHKTRRQNYPHVFIHVLRQNADAKTATLVSCDFVSKPYFRLGIVVKRV